MTFSHEFKWITLNEMQLYLNLALTQRKRGVVTAIERYGVGHAVTDAMKSEVDRLDKELNDVIHSPTPLEKAIAKK